MIQFIRVHALAQGHLNRTTANPFLAGVEVTCVISWLWDIHRNQQGLSIKNHISEHRHTSLRSRVKKNEPLFTTALLLFQHILFLWNSPLNFVLYGDCLFLLWLEGVLHWCRDHINGHWAVPPRCAHLRLATPQWAHTGRWGAPPSWFTGRAHMADGSNRPPMEGAAEES